MKTIAGKTYPERDISSTLSSSGLNTKTVPVKPTTPSTNRPDQPQNVNLTPLSVQSSNPKSDSIAQQHISQEDLKREFEKNEIARLVKWKPEDILPKRYHYRTTERNKHKAVTAVAIFAPRVIQAPPPKSPRATKAKKSKNFNTYATSTRPLLISAGVDTKDVKEDVPAVKVWDLYSMELKKTFIGHGKKVTAIATHPWFPFVVSGDDDGCIVLWDPTIPASVNGDSNDSNKEVRSKVSDKNIHSKTVSSISIVVHRCALEQNALKFAETTSDKNGGGVAHSRQGSIVGSLIRRSSGGSGKEDHDLPQHENALSANVVIVISSTDKKFSVWDGDLKTMLWAITTNHTDLLLSITVIYDEKAAKEIELQDAFEGSLDQPSVSDDNASPGTKPTDVRLKVDEYNEQSANGFTGNRKRKWYESLKIITGSWDKTIRYWPWRAVKPEILRGHMKSVTTVVGHIVQNNDRSMSLLISGSLDKTCIIWDMEKLNVIRVLTGHEEKITMVRVCDQGRRSPPLVVSASEDKTVIIWDLLSGRMLRTFPHSSKVIALDFYRLEAGLMAVTGEASGQVNVWNMLRTERLHTCSTADVIAIDTYRPSLSAACSASNNSTPSGVFQEIKKPMMLIGSIDGKCRTFEIETGKPLGELQAAKENCRVNVAVIYTPPPGSKPEHSSPLLITGDGEAKIAVWDLLTGKKLRNLVTHKFAVFVIGLYDPQKCCLQPSSVTTETIPIIHGTSHPLLITGGIDKRLCVWDLFSTDQFEQVAVGDDKTKSEPPPLADEHGVINVKPLLIRENVHTDFVRTITMFHSKTLNQPSMFVTGSYDRTAVLWDLPKMVKLRVFRNIHTAFVFVVAIYDPIGHCGLLGNSNLPAGTQKDPILVTGGYDGYLAVYNMLQGGEPAESTTSAAVTSMASSPSKANLPNGGEASTPVPYYLQKYLAHKESVTALALYTPKSSKDDPLIISGSIDTMIIVWDLFTGTRLQTLVGHTNRVCYLCVVTLPKAFHQSMACSQGHENADVEGEQPYLLSGGDDQTTIVWEDALHQDKFMPTRDAVYRAFQSDLNNTSTITTSSTNATTSSGQTLHADWPLITELIQTYKHQVFTENSYLFSLAITSNRPDFLLKFHKYLTYMIRFLPELLNEAIVQYDLISVRVILLSWLDCCNRDINNRLEQRLFHASYFLPTKPQLTNLASKYPVEFVMFISGLTLVRNHSSLIDDDDEHNKQKLHLTDRFEILGLKDPSAGYEVTWKHVFEDRTFWYDTWLEIQEVLLYERCSDPQSVTSLMVPLMNSASIEMLGLFVEVSNLLQNVKIFDSPVGTMSLRYYWNSYGKRLHLISMIKYLLCLLIFMFTVYSYQFQFDQQRNATTLKGSFGINVLNVIMIIIFLYYLYEEVEQCRSKFRTIQSKLESKVFTYEYTTSEHGNAMSNGSVSPSPSSPSPPHGSIAATTPNGTSFFFSSFQGFRTRSRSMVSRRGSFKKVTAKTNAVAISTLKDDSTTSGANGADLTRPVRVGAFILSHFIFDVWNFCDVVIIFTGIIGLVLRIIFAEDSPTGRVLLSLTSILMWFKVLYFMRPFSNSGPLVAMIVQISYAIRFFLIALFCVLAGFAQGFWLLSNMDSTSDFGTVKKSLWSAFMTMLGAMLPEFEANHNASPAFARYLMVIFMMVMIVLMLNILIALMGDAFSRVRDSGLALWRKEQATICIDEVFSSAIVGDNDEDSNSHIEVSPYIHVLQYTSDVGNKKASTELREVVDASICHVKKFTPLAAEHDAGED